MASLVLQLLVNLSYAHYSGADYMVLLCKQKMMLPQGATANASVKMRRYQKNRYSPQKHIMGPQKLLGHNTHHALIWEMMGVEMKPQQLKWTDSILSIFVPSTKVSTEELCIVYDIHLINI